MMLFVLDKTWQAYLLFLFLWSVIYFFPLRNLQGSYMMLFVFSTTWRAYLLWVIFSLYEKINNKDFSGVSSAGSGFGV